MAVPVYNKEHTEAHNQGEDLTKKRVPAVDLFSSVISRTALILLEYIQVSLIQNKFKGKYLFIYNYESVFLMLLVSITFILAKAVTPTRLTSKIDACRTERGWIQPSNSKYFIFF